MPSQLPVTYYVDEAGDGVLFGRKGYLRLKEPNSRKFFMLGMVQCESDATACVTLDTLRKELQGNPLYSGIQSMAPEAKKTARSFHAKDDHAEIRAKVFEKLSTINFRFFAVIKDMHKVHEYVKGRNAMDSSYRYHPKDLYDLTARMLFKHRLHKEPAYRITFARRGSSDRTRALAQHLALARERFLKQHAKESEEATLDIIPAYPWEQPCLQIADYALWALQRCYERGEDRFLQALWPKVSLIHDVDDPLGKDYGTYYTRKDDMPDRRKIRNRRI